MFTLALEMGRSVDTLLEEFSAHELQQWMSYFAVRAERERAAAKGQADDDDDVTYWGEEPEDEEDNDT